MSDATGFVLCIVIAVVIAVLLTGCASRYECGMFLNQDHVAYRYCR